MTEGADVYHKAEMTKDDHVAKKDRTATDANSFAAEDALDAAFVPTGSDPDADVMNDDALSEDDTGDLPVPIRRALTVLLKQAYVCQLDQPTDFSTITANRRELVRALANLGLKLQVSERYGCAWTTQANVAGKSPLLSLKTPLPLSRDSTVLVVWLRAQQHAAETRGDENWFADRDEMEDVLRSGPYASDRDGARVAKSTDNAVDKLCALGYLKGIPGVRDRYRIMPILPAVFGLDRARELLAAFNAGKEDDDAIPSSAATDAEATIGVPSSVVPAPDPEES